MFKLRSIAARLILAISLTVATACAILGTFSIIQQRALTQLALSMGRNSLSIFAMTPILLNAGDELPEAELRHCVGQALTYHLRKRQAGRG